MGRARTRGRRGTARRAVSLGPLPRDRPQRPERSARRVGDDLRPRCPDQHDSPGDARHPGHVPQAVRPREARHDRRPHLRRTRRAGSRRGLVRVGAHCVRLRLHDHHRPPRRARPPARRDHAPVDATPTTSGRSRSNSHTRGSSSAGAPSRARSRQPSLRGRVQHRLADGGRGARAKAASRRGGRPRPGASPSPSR